MSEVCSSDVRIRSTFDGEFRSYDLKESFMTKIFVVDDSEKICLSLSDILTKEGYQVLTYLSPKQALAHISDEKPDVVLVDIFFEEGQPDGEWMVQQMSAKYPGIPCLMMSGESDIYKILACLKQGAVDFIEKPVLLPRLLTSIKNALKLIASKQYSQNKCPMIGKSQVMTDLLVRIRKLANLEDSILIIGESGTGKELVAENLHLLSNRFGNPFLRLNCAALSPQLIESELFGHQKGSFTGADTDKKGFFELASSGTLFLDEIGDLPLGLQSKLLRVLQEKSIIPVGGVQEISINTRILSATHQNLDQMVQKGLFREDLLYRIATFRIPLPPLRERLDDIDDLAPYLLQKFLDANNLGYKEFLVEAIKKLKTYKYPGNVRELAAVIKNAVVFSDDSQISEKDIQFHSSETQKIDLLTQTQQMNLAQAKDFLEKRFLEYRIQSLNHDLNLVAESLGLHKPNLYRKMKEYGVA